MTANEIKIKSGTSVKDILGKIVRNQLFIPLVALLLLILFNLVTDPGFFKIALEPNSDGNMVLSGNLITMIDYASELVILARWLLADPVYLILDEPTRGIDVGTKVEIQKLVLKLAAEGKSVTFISSEIDEMIRTCSRLIVMRDGKVVGELKGDDLNQNKIMATIAGGES